MTAPRYAIYYAPAPGCALWRFGTAWLGRDELRDTPCPQPALSGFTPQEFAALTSEPRRYGLHATLKAPFRLRADADESALLARADALASTLRVHPLGMLVPVAMEGFVALVPAQVDPSLKALAARCVQDLDDLRAPPEPQELARRRPELLDARGRELLHAWGYPHVLERFRFHITLSGPVSTAVAGALVAQLAPQVARLQADEPVRLDRLCVFREATSGAAFRRIHDVELPS